MNRARNTLNGWKSFSSFLLVFLFLCFSFGTFSVAALEEGLKENLPSGALVITHATRYYHTNPRTIAATRKLLSQAKLDHQDIFLLSSNPLPGDRDWYTQIMGKALYSRAGEHPLYPANEKIGVFRVDVAGGYDCACLGRTVSDLVSRFVTETSIKELQVNLYLDAIYTGFRFDSKGQLNPSTPYEESYLDDSVDGLNFYQVTSDMNDEVWADFLMDSLKWAVMKNYPMRPVRKTPVLFRLYRQGRLLEEFDFSSFGGEPTVRPERIISFNYLTTFGGLKQIRSQ